MRGCQCNSRDLSISNKEKNMEVPPLCSCADSMGALESGKPIWDSCANNCQFRNNPKDVKRIVSDLVRSVKYSLA